MDKGMKNLHLKPNEAVILRGNWDDSNSDSNDMGWLWMFLMSADPGCTGLSTVKLSLLLSTPTTLYGGVDIVITLSWMCVGVCGCGCVL